MYHDIRDYTPEHLIDFISLYNMNDEYLTLLGIVQPYIWNPVARCPYFTFLSHSFYSPCAGEWEAN